MFLTSLDNSSDPANVLFLLLNVDNAVSILQIQVQENLTSHSLIMGKELSWVLELESSVVLAAEMSLSIFLLHGCPSRNLSDPIPHSFLMVFHQQIQIGKENNSFCFQLSIITPSRIYERLSHLLPVSPTTPSQIMNLFLRWGNWGSVPDLILDYAVSQVHFHISTMLYVYIGV